MSILTGLRVISLALGHIAGSWQDNRREVKRLECGYLLLHNGGNVAWAGYEGARLWLEGQSAQSLLTEGKAFSC